MTDPYKITLGFSHRSVKIEINLHRVLYKKAPDKPRETNRFMCKRFRNIGTAGVRTEDGGNRVQRDK